MHISAGIAVLTFAVGLGTGFIGSYVGGAALLSIPFLIFIGLPPAAAVATYRLASTGMTFANVARFLRSDKIQWKFVGVLSVLAIAGGVIGAHIVIGIEPKHLQLILGLIILALVPVIVLKDRFATEDTQKVHKPWHLWLGYFLWFLIAIFGGFCGSGAMIMMVLVTTSLFGFTILQANATNNVPWLLLCFASLYVFIRQDLIDWSTGAALLAGTLIGGYLGAHVALAQGDRIVKKAFIVLTVISGLVLVFQK